MGQSRAVNSSARVFGENYPPAAENSVFCVAVFDAWDGDLKGRAAYLAWSAASRLPGC